MGIDGTGENRLWADHALMAEQPSQQRPAFRFLKLKPLARVGAPARAMILIRILVLSRHLGRVKAFQHCPICPRGPKSQFGPASAANPARSYTQPHDLHSLTLIACGMSLDTKVESIR